MKVWEPRLRHWIDELDRSVPPGQVELARPLLDAWFDGGEPGSTIERLALPQPWVGNPASPDLAAVMIGFHPGCASPEQLHPDGALVRQVRKHGWQAAAANWALPAAVKARWEARACWPARLLCLPANLQSIVGMDLVPWHAPRSGSLLLHDRHVGPDALRWLQREVILPAVEIAQRTQVSRRNDCSHRRPVLFGLTEGVRKALEHLGWSRLAHIDAGTGPGRYAAWPRDQTGAREERSFSVLLQPAAPWTIAIVTAGGAEGAEPPASAFDDLVLRLLGEHACPCAAAHRLTRAG